MEEKKYSYEDLLEIIAVLRGENGCPWDKAQTHESLVSSLLEESYELVDAINNKDTDNIKEELGDVLLQVVMHAQIAKEEGEYTMEDVIDGIAGKLVYRHPHVFKKNEEKIDTPEGVSLKWEELKQKEKQEKTPIEAMDRVAKALPSVMRAQKVYKKACKSGLENMEKTCIIKEINDKLNVLSKCEEMLEKEQIEEQIGNLLFEIAKLSSFFDINAEIALTKSLEKFINRFRYIENSRFTQEK